MGNNEASSLTLILGGARSGKSSFAVREAHRLSDNADPSRDHPETGGATDIDGGSSSAEIRLRRDASAEDGIAPVAQSAHAAGRRARVLFIATAQPFDEEMAARISAHRAERPADWFTLEAPLDIGKTVRECSVHAPVVLLDCLTLLANNVLMSVPESMQSVSAQAALDRELDGLLEARELFPAHWIVVSNEVGLGLVPPSPVGRVYRDMLGRANQRLALEADRVVFMVAGLPMTVK